MSDMVSVMHSHSVLISLNSTNSATYCQYYFCCGLWEPLIRTKAKHFACFGIPLGEGSNRLKDKEKKPLDEQTSGWLASE